MVIFPQSCQWAENEVHFYNMFSLVLLYTEMYFIYNRRDFVDRTIIETYFIPTSNFLPPFHRHGVLGQNMVCLSSYGKEGEKERGRGKRREAAGRAVSGRCHASNSQ